MGCYCQSVLMYFPLALLLSLKKKVVVFFKHLYVTINSLPKWKSKDKKDEGKKQLMDALVYQGNRDSQLQLHIVVTLKKKSAQNSISSNDLV